jgi:O-antigen/teichoic acid export membrane protein
MAEAPTEQNALHTTMISLDFTDISDIFKQFLEGMSAYALAAIVPAFLSLAALTIFTRIFSPTAFGRYSIALVIAGTGSTLLFGWLNRSIIRFASDWDRSDLVGTVFAIMIGIAIGVAIIGTVGYVGFNSYLGQYEVFYFATLAFLLTQGVYEPLLALYQATLNPKFVSLFRSLQAVLAVILAIVLALFVFDHIVGWIWGAMIAMVITVGTMIVVSKQLRTLPKVDSETLAQVTGYGLPMLGWIVGDPLLNQADRLLIEFIQGSAAVGIYASNYSLVDRGLRLALMPVLNTVQPIVIDRWTGDNEQEIESLLQRFTRYFLLIGVPSLILAAVFSKPLSTILLGSEFHEGYIVIPVVGLGVFLWSFANVGQIRLEIKQQTALMSRGLLAVVVFNIIANIPLIIAFGYIGAAIGTVLSYGLYTVFVFAVARERIKWHLPLRTIRNVLVAGSAMVCLPSLLYLSGLYSLVRLLGVSILSIAAYGAVLYFSGEITNDEITSLRTLV